MLSSLAGDPQICAIASNNTDFPDPDFPVITLSPRSNSTVCSLTNA
jgi:hypothetical protein